MPKKLPKFETYKDQLQEQVFMARDNAISDHSRNEGRYRDSWRYYLSMLPAPTRGDKNLSFVEPLLYQAVSALTPTLLNIFTGNERKAVRYQPAKFFKADPLHQAVEEVVNDTINQIVLRENNGHKVFEDAIKEACITGDAFIKYFIQETHDEDTIELSDFIPLEQLISMADNWEFDVPSPFDEKTGKLKKSGKYKGLEFKVVSQKLPVNAMASLPSEGPEGQSKKAPAAPEQHTMLIKGKVKVFRDDKAVKLEQVDFKDFYADASGGSNPEACRYMSHRRIITVGDAIAEGYDEYTLKEATTYDADSDTALSKVELVTGGGDFLNGDYNELSSDPMERNIALWEHYIYSSIPSGKTALYQVITTDTDILKATPVSRMPFAHLQYETVPGSFWGRSLYDICAPLQDELSIFARIMRQNAMNSAFGIWQAKKNGYDRKSLLSLRPGAIVEMDTLGSVQPLELPQLNAATSAYMDRLRELSDKLLAASSDSLTTPEGAPQLAASAIGMLISQGEMKDKVVAMTMARTGIKPLFQGLYELLRDEQYVIKQSDGGSITADKFPSIFEFVIDINTVNDTAIQTNGLFTVMQNIIQFKQAAGGIVSDENLFNFAEFSAKQFGVDAHRFFTNPAENQDPNAAQAAQLASAQQHELNALQLEKAKADVALVAAQIKSAEVQMDESIKTGKATRQQMEDKAMNDYKKLQAEIALTEAKVNAENAKTQVQGAAVGTEIATGCNISGVKV